MDLKKVDEQLDRISDKVCRMHFINPINQNSEKKKFFSKIDYNPVFKYQKVDFDSGELLRKLFALKNALDDNGLALLLKKKIKSTIYWLKMLSSDRNPKVITKYSILINSNIKKSLVNKARKILETVPAEKDENCNLNSNDILKSLKKELAFCGWKVKENPYIGSKIDANINDRTIEIKKGEKFSKRELKRLKIHEIGTHVKRAINGEKTGYKIFAHGTFQYILTEEGLAAYMEKKEGVLSNNRLRTYAGRVLAVDCALKHSFRECYEKLLSYFGSKEAYTIVMRVKRGLIDTSEKGCFAKDHVYLKGFFEVQEYLNKGGDLAVLFKGKIGLKDLKIVKKVLG